MKSLFDSLAGWCAADGLQARNEQVGPGSGNSCFTCGQNSFFVDNGADRHGDNHASHVGTGRLAVGRHHGRQ